MTALTKVIYHALLETRLTAWNAKGKDQSVQEEVFQKIAALADVTHNIPERLNDYEGWDEIQFRKFLGRHDDKWSSTSHAKLLTVYEDNLCNPGKRTSG